MPPVAAPAFGTQPGFAPAVPAELAAFRGGAIGAPLARGIDWIVRVGGSNNNGGTDSSLTALRTGTDGVTTSGSTTMTSATANFTSADINRGICIATGSSARRHKIVAVTNSTTVTLDRNVTATLSGQTWAIGGAWADWRSAWGTAAVTTDANSPVSAGDTVWIGAGEYHMQAVAASGWLPTNEVKFQGDIYGEKTGDIGEVFISAWVGTSKTTTAIGTLIDLQSISNLTFYRLTLETGATGFQGIKSLNSHTCQNMIWRECNFVYLHGSSASLLQLGSSFPGLTWNWLFERCYFTGVDAGSSITVVTGPYDFDTKVKFVNCVGGGQAMLIGGNIAKCGGTELRNCTNIPSAVTSLPLRSQVYPLKFYNNFFLAAQSPMFNLAGASPDGIMVEANNCQPGATSIRSTGSPSNSTINIPAFPNFGFETTWGGSQRPYWEPGAYSAMRAFGASDTGAGPVDVRGVPRPSSPNAWDVGAYQRWNTGVKNTSVTNTGASSLQFTGFGGQDIFLPVDAGTVRLNAYMRYDSNYVGPLPRLEVTGGMQVGVGDYQMPISKESLNAWKLYTITINPTAKGYVTVRFSCLDTSGVGNLYVDDFYVS